LTACGISFAAITLASAHPTLTKATTGSARCCARAASGHKVVAGD
jgi:hypothetical protein